MKRSFYTLAAAFVVLFSQYAFCGTYGGGSGTAEDPYQIATVEHLHQLSADPNNWDKNFIMTEDIDLSDQIYTTAVVAPDTDRTSEDFQGTPFGGVFDGDGHVISNLTIDTGGLAADYLGLFGRVEGITAKVKKLGMVNVNIAGGSGFQNMGCLAGENLQGTITNCYAVGNVSGDESVGGLVGLNRYSIITNCYAVCSVSSILSGGGLMGYNYRGTTINCYAGGSVRGEYSGGLAGYNRLGDFTGSFWNSEAHPGMGAGDGDFIDFMGRTTFELQMQSTFVDEGWDFVGEDLNGTEDIWYMPGCGYPVLSWQPIGVVPDVVGLTEGDAEDVISLAGPVAVTRIAHSKIVPKGFVISQEPSAGCEDAFVTIIISDGHPYEAGSGTQVDPYRIWTADQMNTIGEYRQDWDKQFVLMADIDLSAFTGSAYNVIGDFLNGFVGVFDGNGHIISNFSYTSPVEDYVGLFGCVTRNGQIRGLGLTDVKIDAGEGNYVGGLVGSSEGSITNCYAIGVVGGNNYVGGLVGNNYYAMIKGCYAMDGVGGNNAVGGLVGDNYLGMIKDCYAVGSVSGDSSDVGGLVGRSDDGGMINCYAVGDVSGNSRVGGLIGCDVSGFFSGNFWDKDVNPSLTGVGNKSDPIGVMGRRTVKLQRQVVFTDYGWDFVGESINGSDDVWRVCVDGVGYPRLRWEFDGVGDFECPDGVSGEDLAYFVEHWLTADGRADLDGDGVVGLVDFVLFAEHWMEGV